MPPRWQNPHRALYHQSGGTIIGEHCQFVAWFWDAAPQHIKLSGQHRVRTLLPADFSADDPCQLPCRVGINATMGIGGGAQLCSLIHQFIQSTVEITFLGTSSGVPTRSRNVSSIACRLPQRAEVWLFDCGEGTQHQLLRSSLKSSQIRRIFITHLHGDHIFGLLGLMASCGLAGSGQTIDLYGPGGLADYILAGCRYSYMDLGHRVTIHRVQEGTVYEDEEFVVQAAKLTHRVPAYGYRVVEKDRPGRFRVEQAQAMGIPPGPLYGKLKLGQTVMLPDGRKIRGTQLCDPPEMGRKWAYCTDTVFCEAAVELAQAVDVLIHEATFAHQDADMAFERLHSTSTMAAQVALLAQAKTLLMTHFSPRYAPGNPIQLEQLLVEAQAIFPNTLLAYDFLTYAVERHRVAVGAKV